MKNQDQKSRGFLEHLYEGEFNTTRFPLSGTPVDHQKVQSFVDRYHAIVGSYDPLDLEKSSRIPDSLMSALKELGIFGLTIPKKYGGLGFSVSEYLLVVEAMARSDMALVLIPLAHLSIGLKGIILFGTDRQKEAYLTPAASGEMIFAYALTEPKTGSDAQNIESHARLSDDGTHYILNGQKTYITNGNYAGGMTVFAQLDPENRRGYMGAFIVEAGWDGVEVGKDMPKMGLKVSSTTPIRFRDVKVPKENLLGSPGDGFKIAMTVLNYGRLGLGAAGAGIMNQSAQDMEKRAYSRKQFGLPIAEFELVQEKIVRAKAHAFAAYNMTMFTSRLLEQDPLMNVAIESSHTKLYGTNEAWNTLYDALQLAGGAGYIQTMPYEKRMRDSRVTTIFEGTSEIHSIYPPLTVFRSLGKELAGRGVLGKAALLIGLARPRLDIRKAGHDATLRRALATARAGEKLFRRLLRVGLTRYGSGIVKHQFHLRRMTRLSVSLYALVASVAILRSEEADRSSRGDSGLTTEKKVLLNYLIAEAQETQGHNRTTGTTAVERAHREVMTLTVK